MDPMGMKGIRVITKPKFWTRIVFGSFFLKWAFQGLYGFWTRRLGQENCLGQATIFWRPPMTLNHGQMCREVVIHLLFWGGIKSSPTFKIILIGLFQPPKKIGMIIIHTYFHKKNNGSWWMPTYFTTFKTPPKRIGGSEPTPVATPRKLEPVRQLED